MGRQRKAPFWESGRAILGSTLLCFALHCTYIQYLDSASIVVEGLGKGEERNNERHGFDSSRIAR